MKVAVGLALVLCILGVLPAGVAAKKRKSSSRPGNWQTAVSALELD
jgi:hypothetical protein